MRVRRNKNPRTKFAKFFCLEYAMNKHHTGVDRKKMSLLWFRTALWTSPYSANIRDVLGRFRALPRWPSVSDGLCLSFPWMHQVSHQSLYLCSFFQRELPRKYDCFSMRLRDAKEALKGVAEALTVSHY